MTPGSCAAGTVRTHTLTLLRRFRLCSPIFPFFISGASASVPHCSDPSCASGQRSPLPICSALNKGLCVSALGVSWSCRCPILDSKSYPSAFSSISLPTWGSSCLPKTFTSTSNSRTPKLCLRSPEALPEFHLSF